MNDIAMNTREREQDKALVEQMHRADVRAQQLMRADPTLPFMSAFVMASDQLQGETNLARLMKGELDFARAMVFTGSYGRMALMLAAFDKNLINRDQALDALIDNWSGSDPDDTDERFLRLWYQAWERNGNRTIEPDGVLPRRYWLTVYRGQDLDAPWGIAWSLDETIARKFANGAATRQRQRGGVVITGRVAKLDVLAYLTERGESEVILDPETVKVDR